MQLENGGGGRNLRAAEGGGCVPERTASRPLSMRNPWYEVRKLIEQGDARGRFGIFLELGRAGTSSGWPLGKVG